MKLWGNISGEIGRVSYSLVLQQDPPPLPCIFATVLIHSFRVRLSKNEYLSY